MTNEQILKKAIENPGHILCFFIKDNYKIAKAFWGEEKHYSAKYDTTVNNSGKHTNHRYCQKGWQYHLQQLVLEKDKLKYLKKFI